jgi:hypothetical protein
MVKSLPPRPALATSSRAAARGSPGSRPRRHRRHSSPSPPQTGSAQAAGWGGETPGPQTQAAAVESDDLVPDAHQGLLHHAPGQRAPSPARSPRPPRRSLRRRGAARPLIAHQSRSPSRSTAAGSKPTVIAARTEPWRGWRRPSRCGPRRSSAPSQWRRGAGTARQTTRAPSARVVKPVDAGWAGQAAHRIPGDRQPTRPGAGARASGAAAVLQKPRVRPAGRRPGSSAPTGPSRRTRLRPGTGVG